MCIVQTLRIDDQFDLVSSFQEDGQLQSFDVVCGKGRVSFNHSGNIRFRTIVNNHLNRYSKATSKAEKSAVVVDILADVRTSGDFVRLDKATGSYGKVTERTAREKVGQAIRDALHSVYRSSTLAKSKRRVAAQIRQEQAIMDILNGQEHINNIVLYVKDRLGVETNPLHECELEAMFMAANMRILKELKDGKCAEALRTVMGHVREAPPSMSLAAIQNMDVLMSY